MATYTYTLGNDAPLIVRMDQLRDELSVVVATTSIKHVSEWDGIIRVVSFDDVTTSEKTSMDAVVANHVPQDAAASQITAELVDDDGDTSIRLQENPFSDEDTLIIKTDGKDRMTIGGINYNAKVMATKDDTGSDWLQHQIGDNGSAYTVMKRSSGDWDNPGALTDGTKVGGYAFALDDGNAGATPQYGAEIAAYALGDQSPTNGGAELRIGLTRQNTKGRQRVLTATADDIKLHAYPDTRDDGDTDKALYVDSAGNLKHGSIVGGGGGGGAQPQRIQMNTPARVTAYTDRRWITNSDDQYGFTYPVWSESGGTGTNPIYEWEHMGYMIEPGTIFRGFKMQARTNNTQLVDMTYSWVFRRPDSTSRYTNGFDSDGEMVNTVVFQDNWMSSTVQTPFTGNSNDMRRRKYTGIDYVFPVEGMLSLYFKPVGTLTSTRYFYCNLQWDIEIPA